MVAADIGDVFLNLDEFGELHTVEGREIIIVLAPDQQLPISGGYTLGVSGSSITIEARSSDLPRKKESGQNLNIDGREYIIDTWNEHMGMSEIKLSQHRSGMGV